MVDDHDEARMPLREARQLGHVLAGQNHDGNAESLARSPVPFQRGVMRIPRMFGSSSQRSSRSGLSGAYGSIRPMTTNFPGWFAAAARAGELFSPAQAGGTITA